MNFSGCINCYHSNTDRRNDLGEIRCVKFSAFVKPSQCCNSYINKSIKELQENLKRGEQNAR